MMKKKISAFLAVMVFAVALFSVPTLAADDSADVGAVTANDISRLAAGETVVKTETVVDPNTGEIITFTSEMGPVPTAVVQPRDIGTKNGWFFHKYVWNNGAGGYGYSRVEFQIDAAKTKIVDCRATREISSENYYAKGGTGGVTVSEIDFVVQKDMLNHSMKFTYNGSSTKAIVWVYLKNGVFVENPALFPA